MNNKSRADSRPDNRGEYTRRQLIECAESLFSQQGIDGVSLRQIGTAIGSSNTNIVGYHFGTKEDLINAIFEHRLPWLENRRGELYQQFTDDNLVDLDHLLYAFWWPLFEQKNAAGIHSYAGFLAELLRAGRGELRQKIDKDYPVARQITADILGHMPPLKTQLYEERMHIAAMMATTMLTAIDKRASSGLSAAAAKALFFDGLAMVAAALTAPTGRRPAKR